MSADNPDSVFAWRFDSLDGDSWGGNLVEDSARYNPGDTIAGASGTYTIVTEDPRGTDLGSLGLDEGQVFVEWYFDRQSGTFLPTRNGAAAAAGFAGLGSEMDAAWTGGAWASFGAGGRFQADAAPVLATLRLTWVFEAYSGDRWEGLLFGTTSSPRAGDILETAHGVYRVTASAALPAEDAGAVAGTVRVTGTYFDNASGARFAIQAPDGGANYGTAGLGSEIGLAWNGTTSLPFGQGGAMQVDAPLQFRPLYRGFGVEAGGWTSQNLFPRMLADLDGDGRPDIVGFGNAGVVVAKGLATGGFGPTSVALGAFGLVAGGWVDQVLYPRMMADTNGDGRADVIGFGNDGLWVARASAAGGFEAPQLRLGAFGVIAGGWMSQERYPRMMADVNGDGRADVVGFGNDGVLVTLANAAGGFDAPQVRLGAFGVIAGGWMSQDLYPRMMADVNGDGRADVVGFGNDGVLVALGNAAGGFGTPQVRLGAFGVIAGGWMSQDLHPRMMADVNGDGRADVVGFGNDGVLVALANAAGGFGAPQLVLNGYGLVTGGWTSQSQFPRLVADLDGDGRAEVVGFGSAGIWADTLWF